MAKRPRLTHAGWIRTDDGPWQLVCLGVSRAVCRSLLLPWRPAADVQWWLVEFVVLPAGVDANAVRVEGRRPRGKGGATWLRKRLRAAVRA
jgi:hypothetical protein